MTAKKYRLETLLEIRGRAKDEAARQIAVRLRRLEQAEEELTRRRRNLQHCLEKQNAAQTKMAAELAAGMTARIVIAHQNFLSDLRRQEIELRAKVETQIETVAAVVGEIEKAREKLTEAARELKAVELHKEDWQASENRRRRRRAQKLGDEIGAILHERRKKE